MKIDRQKATYEAINQELESTGNQLVKTHALELTHTKQTLSQKIHVLTTLNEDLKTENEKFEVKMYETCTVMRTLIDAITHMQLQIKTYAEKLSKQEQTIEQLQHDFRDHDNGTSIQQELQDLEQLYTQGECGIVYLYFLQT